MTAIINFLTGIADGIIALVEFMASMIADVLYVVQLTAEFVVQIPSYLAILPTEILAIVTTAFVVVVIYKILGREG